MSDVELTILLEERDRLLDQHYGFGASGRMVGHEEKLKALRRATDDMSARVARGLYVIDQLSRER